MCVASCALGFRLSAIRAELRAAVEKAGEAKPRTNGVHSWSQVPQLIASQPPTLQRKEGSAAIEIVVVIIAPLAAPFSVMRGAADGLRHCDNARISGDSKAAVGCRHGRPAHSRGRSGR
ncbi:hypothetical protein BRAO375_2690019 [Bradyrhizobium sp. ORS 375]|nr:hypothetical protein BRAO375_2690019 [Bradyrhizobium sp. ORS 375]